MFDRHITTGELLDATHEAWLFLSLQAGTQLTWKQSHDLFRFMDVHADQVRRTASRDTTNIYFPLKCALENAGTPPEEPKPDPAKAFKVTFEIFENDM
jgi:hypothetical protein